MNTDVKLKTRRELGIRDICREPTEIELVKIEKGCETGLQLFIAMSEKSKSAVSGASKLKPFSVDQSPESPNLRAQPDRDYLISSVKRSEEEKSCMEYEINRLTNLLKRSNEKEVRWKSSFQEANSEAIRLNEVALEAKAASARLKVDSIIRENELRKIVSENEELRKRETALLVKVEVLTYSLAGKNDNYNKQEEEFEECEKDYDVVPKWATSFVRVSVNESENEKDENEDYDSEADFEMWESFKIDENESCIENNDDNSGDDKKKMKKKKALLGKIGSLLKKGSVDHK
ncbi:WEB family protein at5g16730 chloroplastic [Phtheirospermum japonicum]|uniref:WEB family protein at5g16730 chloroplastic n=1 Tax=Phtheirospermum japonicum TaxID=374723 RepID=A0A830D0K2_9LAMI|nr:WEB family protein at5g16730 chloroplastic [Phtheirospermum japonicum]